MRPRLSDAGAMACSGSGHSCKPRKRLANRKGFVDSVEVLPSFGGVFAPNSSKSHVFRMLGLKLLESSLIEAPLVLPPGLSLQNDYWFNHFRGIAPAHEHVSYIGALSQQNGRFDALPLSEFYLLLVYSFSASKIKHMM